MLPPADPTSAPTDELAVTAPEATPRATDVERWSVRLELGDDEIAKLYGQGMTRGAVVWRKGMVEWRPLLITAELTGLLRRTRTTLTSSASLPGAEPLPPARSPARVSDSILPPELAQRPVTPITVAPTALDVVPASGKPRRGVEFAAVAAAAFALAWVGRGRLPSPDPPLAPAAATAPSAPARCEPTPSAAATSSPAPSDGIRTVALTDLPAVEGAPATGGVRRGSTSDPAKHRQSSAEGPSRSDLSSALSRVAQAASGCGERGGPVRVVIAFAASGVARSIQVSGADLPPGTRSCIIGAASRARVPAFAGAPVTVAKTL